MAQELSNASCGGWVTPTDALDRRIGLAGPVAAAAGRQVSRHPPTGPQRKGPEAFSEPFLALHPPYAAEAFLFTPLRSATLLSLVFAAFSSLRFVVNSRTTSSWPSSSAHAIKVP